MLNKIEDVASHNDERSMRKHAKHKFYVLYNNTPLTWPSNRTREIRGSEITNERFVLGSIFSVWGVFLILEKAAGLEIYCVCYMLQTITLTCTHENTGT